MKPPKTLLTLTALVALLAVGILFQLPQVAAEDGEEGTTAAQLATLMADLNVSLEDAVKTAKAKTGGTAVEAEFEFEDSEVVYGIVLLMTKDTAHFVKVEVDAKTGKVLEVENLGANGDDDDEADDDEGNDEDKDGEGDDDE